MKRYRNHAKPQPIARQFYLDNLRWLCTLWLIPFHAMDLCRRVAALSQAFLSVLGVSFFPWWMMLLFTIAGVSTAYSMEKRGIRDYLLERAKKLVFPMITCIVLILPILSYYEHLVSGYTNGFLQFLLLVLRAPVRTLSLISPTGLQHLWFVAYLLMISVFFALCRAIVKKIEKSDPPPPFKCSIIVLIFLFILPWGAQGKWVLLSGYSLCQCLIYFGLGLFVLSSETVQRSMEKYRYLILACAVISAIIYYTISHSPPLHNFYAWTTILTLLAFGRRHWNTQNKVTAYLANASFAVYLFHMVPVVVTLFYIYNLTHNIWLSSALCILASFPLTYLIYEVVRRIPGLRFLFAVKK